MVKHLFLLLLISANISVFAQKNYFKTVDRIPTLRLGNNIPFLPQSYHAVEMDYDQFVSSLIHASDEFDYSKPFAQVSLPLPNFTFGTFKIAKTETMEPLLAAKFPSITSYKIWSTDSQTKGRFDISPYGLRATIHTPSGDVYIEPFYKEGLIHYLSYYTKDCTEPRELMGRCGTSNDAYITIPDHDHNSERSGTSQMHKYQLALACTGEWGAKRGTVEKALADLNTLVNRVNLIFENEFASRFILINDNDKLVFLDSSSDPYSNADEGGALLGQNTAAINDILKNSSLYDLGHIITGGCSDVGGIASLGSMCTGGKGAGVTCMGGTGDAALSFTATQIMAHEMGHQMSASHSFNNCTSESQNAGGNGYEPGSGSTIMGYGGLCSNNNIQGRNDPYYHNGSLNQIYNHLRNATSVGFTCAEKIDVANTAPSVTILTQLSGIVIPQSTPFILDGSAVDAEGDVLTYNWEDKSASAVICPLGEPSNTCPSFRSVAPNANPYRIFPSPNLILSDQSSINEVLPTYSRQMEFSFTARDNSSLGGLAAWKEIIFAADGNSGPFRVSYPNGNVNFEAGDLVNVTWDVANTDKAPVSCQSVDIYLSKKNALHPSQDGLTLLASKVPNNGSATVQMPNILGADNRILIRSNGNIFFDISNARFTIKAASKPTAYVLFDKSADKLCGPVSAQVAISSSALGGFTGSLFYEIIDNDGLTASFTTAQAASGVDNLLVVNIDNNVKTGLYKIKYNVIIEGADTIQKIYDLDITSTNFSGLTMISPANGEKDAELPKFTWSKQRNAVDYTFEVSKSPLFNPTIISTIVSDTFYSPPKTFDKKSIYYWRIRANNACKSSDWTELKAFGTLTQDCRIYSANNLPVNISTGASTIIETKINVPTGKNISDINISKLKISHTNFQDLTGILKSAAGKEVVIWDAICPKSLNIEVLVDDQAPNSFGCSATSTGQYRPQEQFAKFNGEDATGVWSLILKDNKVGNGGKLDKIDLEICASVDVENPTLVVDNPLVIGRSETKLIDESLLKVEDKNNTAEQLTFTIVQLPKYGKLFVKNQEATVGTNFTQADVKNNQLTFTSDNVDNIATYFTYLVTDPEGGWLGINPYNISISPTTAIADVKISAQILIFPNPTSGFVFIELGKDALTYNKLSIYNSLGNMIANKKIGEKERIDISSLNNGVYLLKFEHLGQSIVKKLIIANQ